MRIVQEEVFSPVLSIMTFDSEEEVIRMANDSEYGLAAGIWTNDLKRSHRMARALEAGTIWIKTYRTSALGSPFGGYKNSGLGREMGIEAINDFMQTKSVLIQLSDEIRDPFTLRTFEFIIRFFPLADVTMKHLALNHDLSLERLESKRYLKKLWIVFQDGSRFFFHKDRDQYRIESG